MSLDLKSIQNQKIIAFCIKWKLTELALFGSAIRHDFNSSSDIDILVSFSGETKPTLFQLTRMQAELADIFGRDVDIVTRRGIENSSNHIRKNQILSTAQTIYVA